MSTNKIALIGAGNPVETPLMQWTTVKPDFKDGDVFVTKTMYGEFTDYKVWQVKEMLGENEAGENALYDALLNGEGDEYDALEDLTADEYLIIKRK